MKKSKVETRSILKLFKNSDKITLNDVIELLCEEVKNYMSKTDISNRQRAKKHRALELLNRLIRDNVIREEDNNYYKI